MVLYSTWAERQEPKHRMRAIREQMRADSVVLAPLKVPVATHDTEHELIVIQNKPVLIKAAWKDNYMTK